MAKDYIIPLFLPHAGCKTHCIFCNEYSATGEKKSFPDLEQIEKKYMYYKKVFPKNVAPYIAFYGGTFTGLREEDMIRYLDWAQKKIEVGEVQGIRFSTSPEEITEEKIKILKNYKITLVELGVQSFYEDVLKVNNRPHELNETWQAIEILNEYRIDFGIHLMTGLLNSSYFKDINSAIITTFTGAKYVRIHPTVVLKGAPLEILYRNNKYEPESLEEAIEKVAKMYMILESEGIKVIRMGICLYGEQKKNVLAGPYHDAFGNIVKSFIFNIFFSRFEYKKATFPIKMKSEIFGYKGSNKKYLDERISFHKLDFIIIDDERFSWNKFLKKILEEVDVFEYERNITLQ